MLKVNKSLPAVLIVTIREEEASRERLTVRTLVVIKNVDSHEVEVEEDAYGLERILVVQVFLVNICGGCFLVNISGVGRPLGMFCPLKLWNDLSS